MFILKFTARIFFCVETETERVSVLVEVEDRKHGQKISTRYSSQMFQSFWRSYIKT